MFSFLSRRSSLLLFLVSAVLMGYGAGASAITVSPVIYDQTIDPGQSTQGVIRVQNDTQQEQTYYTSVQNFTPQGEEGQQTFLPETDKEGLASWLSLEEPSIALKPGEHHDFKWALVTPKNAEPGGHYAAVFFSTAPNGDQGSNVGIGGRTGVLFLVNVNGNVKESAKINSFNVMTFGDPATVHPTSYLDHLPADFEVRIQNDGSVHIKPAGSVVIKNMLGNRVGGVNLNPNDSRVLPSSIRKIRTAWGPTLENEPTGFFAGLAAEWNGFALGRYTATVEGTYGSQHLPLTAAVTFWVFPWRLFVITLLALFVIALLIKGYNRMVVNAAMKKANK